MSFIYFVALGIKIFCENNDNMQFIVTMLAREGKPASLGVYNANGDALVNALVNMNEN